ncbi:MAG: phosphodiester glycosidase family protein [Oscillospiraceae bacterium]|nr:phosphodiester glycosidase family protein [Oscillospiraceae bacterium]
MPQKKRKRLPWWGLAILDLLLTGLLLCIFALFHHVLPQMRLKAQGGIAPIASPAVTQKADEEYNEESRSIRERFAAKFSEEIIVSENGYKSPDISVAVTEHSFPDASPALTYYVADIYVAQVENFQTCFSEGSAAAPEKIAKENAAVLAMNGDYCLNQRSGLLVRNGLVYMTEQTSCDLCVLYRDGTMATYSPEEYKAEEILEKEPYQTWKFGPALLEKDGSPKTEFNTGSALLNAHPRSGIGYFEPGHYCFVVVDGRQGGYSDGLDMAAFAELFAKLGCVSAYNLDGGASSVMVLGGETVNAPCNGGRYVSDMLIIKELEGLK